MINVPQLTSRFLASAVPSSKLVVVLHGRGDSMEGFAWLPRSLGLPAVNYLFLNAPEPYMGGFSWYGLPPDQGPGILRSRRVLFEVLDALATQGFSSEDIVLLGFSQGCLMSLEVALRYPHRLGGVVGISGYIWSPERAESEAVPQAFETAYLVTHGVYDDVLPIDRTRDHLTVLQGLGLPIEYHEFLKAHTIDPDRELPMIRNWLAARLDETAPA